jgi:hypothetical protein
MDDQLLNDLYGIEPQDQQDDDMIKAAQAELVEAVADEAGIDLAEMDDAELDKFASYVLSDASDDVYTDPSLAEADQMGRVMAHAYADEQMKIAHQLQQDYLTEGDDMYDDLEYALEKQAEAWDLVKEAADVKMKDRRISDRVGLTRRGENQSLFRGDDSLYRKQRDAGVSRSDMLRSLIGRGTGYYDIKAGRGIGKTVSGLRDGFTDKLKDVSAKDLRAQRKAIAERFKGTDGRALRKEFRSLAMKGGGMKGTAGRAADKLFGKTKITAAERKALMQELQGVQRGAYMRGAGKAGLVAGGLGLAGYGASRSMSKKSSYDPVIEMVEDLDGWEFAKEAELRAAEILLENGIDPETFEETYPESVKLASFPEPGEAYTYEGDEDLIDYNEMLDDAAYDILEDLGF